MPPTSSYAGVSRAEAGEERQRGARVDKHIGGQLRRRRRLMNLTQQDVADACGVSFQQIQKYEGGVSRLDASRLWRIAGLLGVSVSYFFDGLARNERPAGAPD